MSAANVNVVLSPVTYRDGTQAVRAVVYGIRGGRYASLGGATIAVEGPIPEDPEELVAVALTGLYSAVYNS